MTDPLARQRTWRLIWQAPLFVLGLLAWTGIGLVYTLLGVPARLLLPRAFGQRLGQRLMRAVFGGFIGYMRVTGIGRFDLDALDVLRDQAPVVIAPNHPSLFDAVLVVSRLPNVVCTMKTAVLQNPILSGGAAFAGYVANAHPKQLIQDSVRRLHGGAHVLVFPEGTRTTEVPLNEFRGSFVLIAKRARVPIQTVFIESNTRFLGKGWNLFSLPRFPLIYKIRLGARFDGAGDTHTSVEAIYEYFVNELAPARRVPSGAPQLPSRNADDPVSDIVLH
jgi:1-acyl-sn-glycerol-3-phosphate acyltransferase